MLTNFFSHCDVQLVSDSLSEYLISKYESGELGSDSDPIALCNDFFAEYDWISDICRRDVGCAADILSIVASTVKSPYYMIPESVIKKSV